MNPDPSTPAPSPSPAPNPPETDRSLFTKSLLPYYSASHLLIVLVCLFALFLDANPGVLGLEFRPTGEFAERLAAYTLSPYVLGLISLVFWAAEDGDCPRRWALIEGVLTVLHILILLPLID